MKLRIICQDFNLPYTNQYDAVGNVLQKTTNGNSTVYQYDVNDRLLSENKQGQVTSYTYDQQGNTLTETRAGQTKTYVYNSQNQLIKSTINGQQQQFSYDSNGIRQAKLSNGQLTQYVVDHNHAYAQVLAEYGQNSSTLYTYGDALISQTVNNGNQSQSHYLLKDALGSTKALADATGTITDSYAYDAYGEIIASAGSTPNSYKFAGEQYDQDLGMYYNRARYYNQSIGRFSQMDSWQGKDCTPITLNKYVYANAAPTMYTDPSGNMALIELMIGVQENVKFRNAENAQRINHARDLLKKACEIAGTAAKTGFRPLKGFARHHVVPFFLQGKPSNLKKYGPDEGLVLVVNDVHNKLHSLMDLVLKSKGLTGRSGSYKPYATPNPDTFGLVKESLDITATIYDDVCGQYSKPYRMKKDLDEIWDNLGLK